LRSNSICVIPKNPIVFGDVEDQRGNDAHAKLPFEAEPYVEKHSAKCERGRHQAVAKQLRAHPGAHDLDTSDLHIG
jgi:hypothetical protein